MLFFALLCALVTQACADSEQERLVNVGVRIFPAIIAASNQFDQLTEGQAIQVDVIYLDDDTYARQIAGRISRSGPLKGHPIQTRVIGVATIKTPRPSPYALFVVQRLGEEIGLVAEYGLEAEAITFSPFRGDVEAGILSGLAISDRILPYINQSTLSSLNLKFKPFFLKVAETYAR